MTNHWTDRVSYEIMGGDSPGSWFEFSKLIACIRAGGTLYKKEFKVSTEIGQAEFVNLLSKVGFQKIYENLDPEAFSYFYKKESAIIQSWTNPFKKAITVFCKTTDRATCDQLHEIFKEYILEDEDTQGDVHILQAEAGELSFSSFGNIDEALERNNYSEDILDGFDYIVSQLESKNPSGRITLLEGEPGTGKSYFIRGLINKVKGKFIIVPTNQVNELASPHFVPAIINLHNDYCEEGERIPIVFIVEDADSLIVNRTKGNVNVLSTVLNIGDGILGQLFDIRMILSTNASGIKDIDPALLRPGRLTTHIIFNKLPYEKANEIFKRISEGAKELNKNRNEFTLAEVYGEAANSRALIKESKVTFGGNYQ